MTIHEFGNNNTETLILIHPGLVLLKPELFVEMIDELV